MAKINGSEIRPGMVVEHDGTIWVAVKSSAVKPGKGPAYNQVELKNLLDGRKLNQRFGADERVEQTHVERKDFQFRPSSLPARRSSWIPTRSPTCAGRSDSLSLPLAGSARSAGVKRRSVGEDPVLAPLAPSSR